MHISFKKYKSSLILKRNFFKNTFVISYVPVWGEHFDNPS